MPNNKGETPIHYAADTNSIFLFVKTKGINWNQQCNNGETVLHKMVMKGLTNTASFQQVLDLGANCNVCDVNGK